jgi:hypothetical protein
MRYDDAGNLVFDNVEDYARNEFDTRPEEYQTLQEAYDQAVELWESQGWPLDKPRNIRDFPAL